MRTFARTLAELGNTLAGFVYPEVCQICGNQRAGPSLSYVCGECRRRVVEIRDPVCSKCGRPYEGAITQAFECQGCVDHDSAFEWARSAVIARDTVLEAIHRYKYERALCLEPFLATLLVEAAAPRLVWTDWDAIIPVPLFPARQRDREFNQAERLARHLSRATAIPVQSGWVKRIEPTKSQTRLSREERKENVRGAFACRPGSDLSGTRLLVVDDVFTTGSTTNACATVLRRSGAARVCVWTLARGI